MTLSTWVLFCLTEAVLCVIPGPAVLLVVSTALARGTRPGLRASFGILAANTFYFLLSATSLGALLLASYELFTVIRWAGSAYLIWIGARMVLSWWRGEAAIATADAPDATEASRRGRKPGPFTQGFMVQGANPKALLFFSAILPQFIDPNASVPLQVGILAVSSIVIELAVLALYAAAAQPARSWASRPGSSSALQATAGILLIAAGVRLAAQGHT